MTKETTVIPVVPGNRPVGSAAREITATDSDGNAITNLSSDATIELSYSGSEILETGGTGMTLEDVGNIQISYYDTTSSAYVPLETSVQFGDLGSDEFRASSATLLSDYIDDNGDPLITFRAQTSHFTLFTALVSTAVANSDSGGSSSSSGSTSSTSGRSG